MYIHIYIFSKLLSQRNAEAFRNLTAEFSFSKLEWGMGRDNADPSLSGPPPGEEGWLKNLLH